MMKRSLLLLAFIISTTSLYANKIDSLRTNKDVTKFIQTCDSNLKYYAVMSLKTRYRDLDEEYMLLAHSLGMQPWQKTDLNDDGETDLLVNVCENASMPLSYSLAIISSGGKTEVHYISVPWDQPAVCIPQNKDGHTLLKVYKRCYDCRRGLIDDSSTLILRNGNFIEYNAHPVPINIDKISLKVNPTFLAPPGMLEEITIEKDGTTVYYNHSFPEYNKQSFTSHLDDARFDTLKELINYINLPALDSNFAVHYTDGTTAELLLEYDGGKTKRISDYGMSGTYGLGLLYGKLIRLQEELHWTKRE